MKKKAQIQVLYLLVDEAVLPFVSLELIER